VGELTAGTSSQDVQRCLAGGWLAKEPVQLAVGEPIAHVPLDLVPRVVDDARIDDAG
jgi:hypothetical protein